MSVHPLFASLLPLVAAFPTLAGQDGTQQTSAVDVIGLNRDIDGRMTVPVRISAKGPFDFLIDTGSQNTVLSRSLAERLSLTPTKRATLVGIAGTTKVDAIELDQIDLGRRSFYGLFTPLLEGSNIGADGILGLDSLQGQRVVIDFGRKLMSIGDAKSQGGNSGYEIVVTAKRRSGQLIMTDARIDGVWADVVIDTGAETTIGNRALQRALEKRHRKIDQVMLGSVTGQQILADIGTGGMLNFDDLNINNVMIAFADSPAFAALNLDKKPALFLGMRELKVFKRVAIDFSTRKILFDLPGGVRNIEGMRQ